MTALLPVLRRTGWLGRPEVSLVDKFLEGFGLGDFFAETETWLPAFDVSETEDAFVVRAEVPGMNAKDIDITLSDGILTIKGEKKHEKEEKKEDYHLVERRYGAFHRSLRIPAGVETGKVDAACKDGVLKITLPKAEEEKAKKIEVTG